MKAHADLGCLPVLPRFDEDVGTRTFHCAAEIHLQFRVVTHLEVWDIQHRHCVIRSHGYRSNLFAHRIRYRNHRQSRRHVTAEEDLSVSIIGR